MNFKNKPRNALWSFASIKHSPFKTIKKIDENDSDLVVIKEEIVFNKKEDKEEDLLEEIKLEEKSDLEIEEIENQSNKTEEDGAKYINNQIDIKHTNPEMKKSYDKVTDWFQSNPNIFGNRYTEVEEDNDLNVKPINQQELNTDDEENERFFHKSASLINEPINKIMCNTEQDSNIEYESNEIKMNDVIDIISMVNCISKGKHRSSDIPWVSLKVKETYEVNVTEFNGSEFFVELADDNIRNSLKRRLKKVKLTPSLDQFKPGDHCLVEAYGKIHRAMVQFYNADSACCYSVDTGEIFYFEDSLNEPPFYKMPSKIRKIIPFQAIRCKFHGLYIRNNVQWIDFIRTTVIQRMQKPSIFVISRNETSDDNNDPLKAMDEYAVILQDLDGDRIININNLLIQYQLAEENMSNIIIS
ncbi:hypothetical protein PVAND_000474 [Polypedilum vanderplanki]|uniref:Tudor domain-containing protein n=1 Tax=Polypedilum vanderplanki TaxID=319348 RepID=A0A9J6BK37_POLVA|nr:hypothetical protein PVAND_000474 [Polypedilum vanderplanki]